MIKFSVLAGSTFRLAKPFCFPRLFKNNFDLITREVITFPTVVFYAQVLTGIDTMIAIFLLVTTGTFHFFRREYPVTESESVPQSSKVFQ